MIVLGFDTATPATAVALSLSAEERLERRDDPPAGAHPGHATRLLAMARELLAEAGVGWPEIERIAVGVGPGTFTGLRVGIATARGLAQSLGCDLAGVSTPHALAEAVFNERLRANAGAGEAPAGSPGEYAGAGVMAVIDARRGEAFAAAYEAASDGRSALELLAPRALSPERLGEVPAEASAGEHAEQRSWLAVGDGAVRFRSALEARSITVPADGSPLNLVSAAAVCELGRLTSPAVDAQRLLPDYVRRPDAELALETAAGARSHG